MKSIAKVTHNTNIFTSGSKIIQKRNYNNLQDFLVGYKKSHLALDAMQISEHATNLVLCRNDSPSFSFESHLGYYISQSDIIAQQGISAMSKSVTWHWNGFSVKSIIDNSFVLKRNIDPRLMQDWNFFNQKKIVHQKCNTVQELVCATTAPKAFRVDSVSFNQSKYPIPFANNNLTCNSYPDYACAVVLQGGFLYKYYADLKVTTLASFESKILCLHKSNTVSCNFYFISDIGPKHIFSYNTKMELEKTYNFVCAKHLASGNFAAVNMVNQSKFSFNNFRFQGDVESYNQIPVNTPKFLTLDFIRSIFY